MNAPFLQWSPAKYRLEGWLNLIELELVEKDWVLDEIDYTKFSNIEPGDILFWDSDGEFLDRFMACSHTSICVGKDSNGNNMMIEGNSDGIIKKCKISDKNVNNLLFVGRINLDK